MTGSKLIFWGETETGKRKNNEDALLFTRPGPRTILLAVADGMGGGVAGEVASATVIEELARAVSEAITPGTGTGDLKMILSGAYRRVQERVQQVIAEQPHVTGMGTTLTVLLVHGKDYVYGNLGDSRLYMIRPDGIRQLTRDHSHVQELIDRGESPDEDYVARHANLITKCIGGSIEEPDIYPLEKDALTMQPGTGFLLCSDGLIPGPSEAENNRLIHQTYLAGPGIRQVTRDLIGMALQKGSRDNITVVALDYGFHRKKQLFRARGRTGNGQDARNRLSAYRIVFPSLAAILVVIAAIFLTQHGIRTIFPEKGRAAGSADTLLTWENQFTIMDEYTTLDHLRWKPYPDSAGLQEVRIVQFGGPSGTNQVITDQWNTGKTPVSSLRILPSEAHATVKVRIEAVLANDSIIMGDTALINIKQIH